MKHLDLVVWKNLDSYKVKSSRYTMFKIYDSKKTKNFRVLFIIIDTLVKIDKLIWLYTMKKKVIQILSPEYIKYWIKSLNKNKCLMINGHSTIVKYISFYIKCH